MSRPICGRMFTLLLASAVMVTATAQAQPTVVEPGWTLIRSIPFDNPQMAHYNAVDGLTYVGRLGTSSDGLYRISPCAVACKIADGDRVTGVVVDDDGDVFFSEAYAGMIYRTEFGGIGRTTWVSGFHSGDDDPDGMAIAPEDYSGGVLAPGEALVVDEGYSGADEVWRWSPDTPEEETLVHPDDGTLICAVDVTIGTDDVFLVDAGDEMGGPTPGTIYRLEPGGSLTVVQTQETIVDPFGITIDPLTDDLLVLDAADGRVIRVEPTSGAVSNLITGFAFGNDDGWSGIDITPDGRQLIVSDFGGDAIYVFGRCDAQAPEEDCNANGQYDACDLALGISDDCNGNGIPDECDLNSGTSEDCDGNQRPDECPCPTVQVVFVMDTSDSMDGEAEELCCYMGNIVDYLWASDLSVEGLLLGVGDTPGGPYACLTDTVIDRFGVAVPGNPPEDLDTLGDCPGGLEVASEDWGLAVAVVAGVNEWLLGSIRLVIPLSDEGPWCGDPVTQADEDAVAHAIDVALANDVIVLPITGLGSSQEVIDLAEDLGVATGGMHFSSSESSAGVAQAVADIVLDACRKRYDCNSNGVPDTCDIADGTSRDDDGDGIPSDCECPGDLDFDHDVDLADLAQLLAHYGTTSGASYEDGDLNLDGDVDLEDLATLLPLYATLCIDCPADLDFDGDVDLADLAQLIGNYGASTGASYEDGDIDLDGDVDQSDLAALLAVYGTTCE